MTYSLAFLPSAKKEWDKLDSPVKEQFKKKLKERLVHPKVEASRLFGMKDCYKIKLKAVGYRLVYQVQDATITVVVVAIAKRERNLVYQLAAKRL